MKFFHRGASNLQLVSRSSIRRASHVALSAPNPVTTCGNLRHLSERALLGEQCSQWSDHFHLPPQLRLISAQRRPSNCEWCENSLTHRALYYHPSSLPLLCTSRKALCLPYIAALAARVPGAVYTFMATLFDPSYPLPLSIEPFRQN